VAEQIAEKLHPSTSGAKALTETKGFIAALKTLRHPKSSFSANCEATIDFAVLTARLGSRALSKRTRTSGTVPLQCAACSAVFI
jgi:hypothetical protein